MSEKDDLLDPTITETEDLGATAELPNTTATLALGIVSIVTCWVLGIPGAVCGIIAISLYNKDKKIYESNPQKYDASFKNLKAGFVCGIIGLILSGLTLLYFIFALALAGSMGRF